MNKVARSRTKPSGKNEMSRISTDPEEPETAGMAKSWPALRNLSYRINLVHRLLDCQTKKFLSDHFEMTNAEWYVLAYLAWHSPRTIATISTESAIYKSQVSHAVTALVEKGFVLRADDPADKRSPRFRISARGQRIQKKIAEWASDRQRQLAAQLAPHQYAVLDETLDALIAHVKAKA
jgi:DNA-binding MarR family transcriptional regulator